MRILALDLGNKRIGVAVSDELEVLARALATLPARGRNADAEAIAALAAEQEAGRVILGLPLSLSGEDGPQALKVRKFGTYLAGVLSVPLEYWDERFTTVEAARLLRANGVAPRKQRDQIDATAAAILLQSYLDSHAPPRLPGQDPGTSTA